MSEAEARAVAAALAGDERAFRDLYRAHTPTMYRLALRMTAGSDAAAEDVVQEAWSRAVRGLAGFEHRSALRTWLHGIVTRCALERLRGERVDLAGPTDPDALPTRARRATGAASTSSARSRRFLPDTGPSWCCTTSRATRTSASASSYASWARAVAADGIGISGEELSADVTWLAPPGAPEVAPREGPERRPGEPTGLHVAGFFLVDAPDARTARRIAETHPHLAHGGWLEIAPIAARPGG